MKSSFIWVLKSNHITSEWSNKMTRVGIDWLSPSIRERPSSWERLGRDFFRITSERISHCIHIIRTSCNQLPATSGISTFLLSFFYWPCSLKFVSPTINLTFLGIIGKVKLPAKFCLHSFEWLCLQLSNNAKYFSFLVQGIVIED